MRKTKRTNIEVPLQDPVNGGFLRMEALAKVAVMEEVLAAHHIIVYRDGEIKHDDAWIITHVPSGYSLGVPWKTQRHARKVMDRLLDLPDIDWQNEDIRVVLGRNGGKEKILAVLERWMNEEPPT